MIQLKFQEGLGSQRKVDVNPNPDPDPDPDRNPDPKPKPNTLLRTQVSTLAPRVAAPPRNYRDSYKLFDDAFEITPDSFRTALLKLNIPIEDSILLQAPIALPST